MRHASRLLPNSDLPWYRVAPFAVKFLDLPFRLWLIPVPNPELLVFVRSTSWAKVTLEASEFWLGGRQKTHVFYCCVHRPLFRWKYRYHSRRARDGFVVYKVALGQVFLRVRLLFPVTIITRLLHTHSFTYHPRCIMLFSQYFSFPCQYHSTIAPYSLIHLPPTLYNVFLPVLQFSPVSIIPPLLHTHSFIHHPRCIIFFSQHFSFPLSLSFHHCSILFHSTPTLYKHNSVSEDVVKPLTFNALR